MAKTCIPCNAYYEGDVCEHCLNETAPWRMEVEEYKGYPIMKYSYEEGYRVDFGTIRSKSVPNLTDAQDMVDRRLSPDKWG